MAMTASNQCIGSSIERIEDARLLMGDGAYIDDLAVDRSCLYAAIVRSPVPHGIIKSIDVAEAEKFPGVIAVLTIQDVQNWSNPLVVAVKTPMKQWVLANERVRYVGEPIAVVIARTRAIAEDGIELVQLDIEPLSAIVTIDEALQDEALLLHPEMQSNCISDRDFNYGDPEKAFNEAAHIFQTEIQYPRNSCTPLETSGVIAKWIGAEDSYEVTSNFMGPFSLHVVMAAALKVSGNQLRHRIPNDSGGSFGVKQSVLPYVILMCLASRKVGGRQVKFIEDRLEHLQAATSATARNTLIKAAVNSDGKILALDYDQREDCGAYLRAPEPATLYRMHGCLTGPYDIPNLHVRNRVVLLNKTPTGLVRGFGGPQVYFALERLIHQIAKGLGKSHLEIATLNFVKKEQFPYKAAAGALLDSGDYQRAVKKLQLSDQYQYLIKRQSEVRAQGGMYGIGVASIVEPSVSNMGYITTVLTAEQRQKSGAKNGAIAAATVSIDPTGSVNVNIASAPAGQGHRTVVAQLCADIFGINMQHIRVNVEFDTAKDAYSIAAGNYSSRFAGAVAGTVVLAANKLKNRIAAYAAKLLEVEAENIVFKDGKICPMDDYERGIPFGRVCGNFHWSPGLIQKALGNDYPLALSETQFWSSPVLTAPDAEDHINTSAAYGFALDCCGIEIDPISCAVKIDQYITTHDAGKLLNPALADGQVYGAFAQAVGAALFEEFTYSSDGNFLAGTFADYRIPTASEIPKPHILHMETPSPFTPLGAKGIGEGNSMSTPVCIANAIADATGYENIILPATPSRIHQILVNQKILPEDIFNKKAEQFSKNYPLKAKGEVHLPVNPQEIIVVLKDSNRLRNVIPGCEEITAKNLDHGIEYNCISTIRIGVAKARFKAKILFTELDEPYSFKLDGLGSGNLGVAEGVGKIVINMSSTGCLLQYDYQAKVSGKLSAVGSRLLEGTIKIILDQLFKSLAKEANSNRFEPKDKWWISWRWSGSKTRNKDFQ